MEKAIKKMEEYGISSYAVKRWYSIGNYSYLLGFFVALQSVAIIKCDKEGEKVFDEATKICFNKIYNKEE